MGYEQKVGPVGLGGRAAESSNCDSIATRPWQLLRFSAVAVLGRFFFAIRQKTILQPCL